MSQSVDDQLARFLAMEFASSFEDIRRQIDGANGDEAIARTALLAGMSVQQILEVINPRPRAAQILGRVPTQPTLGLE